MLRLDLPPTLARTLRSSNAIESMIGICREQARSVKLWPVGQIALRWYAGGILKASTQFSRFNGHLHLPALGAALERPHRGAADTLQDDFAASSASTLKSPSWPTTATLQRPPRVGAFRQPRLFRSQKQVQLRGRWAIGTGFESTCHR